MKLRPRISYANVAPTAALVFCTAGVALLAAGFGSNALAASSPARAADAVDCDNDPTVEPPGPHGEALECSKAPPAPGKTVSPAEKARARELRSAFRAEFERVCTPVITPDLLAYRFPGDQIDDLIRITCPALFHQAQDLGRVIADPPDVANAGNIAFPQSSPSGSRRRKPCRGLAARACARLRAAFGRYLAAAGASANATRSLADTADRFGGARAIGSYPLTVFQAVAAKVFAGGIAGALANEQAAARVVARLVRQTAPQGRAARARLERFLRALMPPSRPARVFAAQYHSLTLAELAVLDGVLISRFATSAPMLTPLQVADEDAERALQATTLRTRTAAMRAFVRHAGRVPAPYGGFLAAAGRALIGSSGGAPFGLPALVANPTRVDFGSQPIGTTSSRTVGISNPGTAALHISSVQVSSNTGGFSLASNGCPPTLPRGGACQIVVRFTPAQTDFSFAFLQVTSDAPPTGLPTSIELSGSGR